MNFGRTLILDSTGLPVDIVDWKRAMVLVVTNKAAVVDAYDNVLIHSMSEVYKLPSVLQLMARSRKNKDVLFTRKAVFYRDKFHCGYCMNVFAEKSLTLDHIIPVCQGGPKSWENIMSACHPCNHKKGGRTPEEAHMPLKLPAIKPKWNPGMFIRLKKEDPVHAWSSILDTFKIEYK